MSTIIETLAIHLNLIRFLKRCRNLWATGNRLCKAFSLWTCCAAHVSVSRADQNQVWVSMKNNNKITKYDIPFTAISIRRMFEAGLHAYHSSIWEQKKPKCAKSSLIVAPVDIEHFSSALYILLIGMTLSVSVLVTEIIVHRAHKRIAALRERLNYKGHAFEFVH